MPVGLEMFLVKAKKYMLEAGRNPTSYLNRTSGGGNLCIPRRQASLPWRAFEFSSWGDFLVL